MSVPDCSSRPSCSERQERRHSASHAIGTARPAFLRAAAERMPCHIGEGCLLRVSSWLTDKRLEQLHIEDALSIQIAERLGTNRESVRGLIHKHHIQMRSQGAGKRR